MVNDFLTFLISKFDFQYLVKSKTPLFCGIATDMCDQLSRYLEKKKIPSKCSGPQDKHIAYMPTFENQKQEHLKLATIGSKASNTSGAYNGWWSRGHLGPWQGSRGQRPGKILDFRVF